MIRTKRFALPEKFHTLIKLEATKKGKTVTAYLNEIVEEVEERRIEFRTFIHQKKEIKNEKKFIPRF